MLPASPLVFPLGKVLYVADDVAQLPGSTKPSIINLWEIVRVPAGATFPYTLGKLCAVARMRDGLGTWQFQVDIVDAATGAVIRRSRNYSVPFTDRLRSRLVVIRMRDVVFPQRGVYVVELFCNGQFVDDEPIEVL